MVTSNDRDGCEPTGKSVLFRKQMLRASENLIEVLLRHEAAQKLRKSHWMLSNSRQSLVKGERLVRHDMTAVLINQHSPGAIMVPSDDRDGRQPIGKELF